MTRPRIRAVGTLAVVGFVYAAGAAEPTELRKLFPSEADVFVTDGVLSRLDLPASILGKCRPNLSDLRLFDREGKEVPFLVDSHPSPAAEVTQYADVSIATVRREQVRRESRSPLRRETYEIAFPHAVPRSGSWVLLIETRRPQFVARVTVAGIGVDGHVTALVADGSAFRLAGARPAGRTRLPLPRFEGERLRVTLESEEGGWLEPAFRLESARPLEGGGRITAPLEILSRESGGGRTVLELARPRGIVPDLLRLETRTGTFHRKVSVWDEGAGSNASLLGSWQVYRVQALAPVEELELPLRPARGDRLRVEVEDGDSPPLGEPSFTAVVRQPSLVFSLPSPAGSEAAAVLRFGGGRAYLPRYDLAGLLLPRVGTVEGKRAEALARIHDFSSLSQARLGSIRPNADYDGAPALAFAMRPGAKVDVRVFRRLRTLAVAPSSEGLSRLRLEPADLALLRDDMGDLRIADAGRRQWPYLLERDAATELLDLKVDEPVRRDHSSRYRILPPVAPLRLDRILIDTDASFFDRPFRLATTPKGEAERILASGRLARPLGDPRPVPLDFQAARIESLELTVEDGDDAPLSLRSVRARVSVPELFVAAPAGTYWLLLGAPDETAPQYELARVREVVLAVNAEAVRAGELAPNPDYSVTARLGGRSAVQTTVLWGALAAAVVTLLALTLRLARR